MTGPTHKHINKMFNQPSVESMWPGGAAEDGENRGGRKGGGEEEETGERCTGMPRPGECRCQSPKYHHRPENTFCVFKNKSFLLSLFPARRFSERPPIYLIALIIFNCAISKQGVHMHESELENKEPCSACCSVEVSAATQSSQLRRDKYKTQPQRQGNAKQTLQKRTNIMNIYIPLL